MVKISIAALTFVVAMIGSSLAQTLPSSAVPNSFQAGINPSLNPYNNPYNSYNPYNPYLPYNPYNPYNPYQNQFYQPGQNALPGVNNQPRSK